MDTAGMQKEIEALSVVVADVRDRIERLRADAGLTYEGSGAPASQLDEIAWGAHRNAQDLHGDLNEIAEILTGDEAFLRRRR